MIADTVETVNIMTADKTSTRSAQSASKVPEYTQRQSSTLNGAPATTSASTTQEQTAARIRPPQVTIWAARSPIRRPNRPAIAAPSSGRKTTSAANTPAQPRIRLMSSTSMLPRLRK